MTPEPASLPLSAPLEHEAFVRALARRLLDDAHAAEDLAQDTWTELIANPPRAVRSVRAWLAQSTKNRASNARRAAGRRALHEGRAARPDAGVEHDALERLELQSRVVRAVLALREPYRSVVLGRYYEGRSTKELATRQCVTESTVRSQETRALELLRGELDREFDGGRDAWGLALAGWIGEPGSASTPVAGWGVALASAAGLAALAWFGWKALEVPAALPAGPLASEAAEAPAEDASAPSVASALEPEPARQAATATTASDSARPDFDTAPLDELLVLGQQIQRELRERLLTPEPEFVARFADRDAAEYGVVRVLERNLFGAVLARHVDALGIREGGSYFSIMTREHSFDELPTFGLEDGAWKLQGQGGFLPVSSRHLEDLPRSPGETPAGVEPEAWRALWTEVTGTTAGDRGQSLTNAASQYVLRAVPATVGSMYVVRAFQDTDYDVLAAVRVLAADEHGRTIAWRRIHTWPVVQRAWERCTAPPLPQLPAAPRWLAQLGIPALLELQAELRSIAGPRVLAPRGEFSEVERDQIASAELRAARLLNPGRYDALLDVGGGGAWLDLDTGDRAFRGGTTLYLGGDVLRAGGHGGSLGVVVDLGDIDMDEVERCGARAPERFDAALRAQWEFAWSVRAPTDDEGRSRRLPRVAQLRVGELGLQHGAPAKERHTYLARVIPWDARQADVIAAIRHVHADGEGHTIAWRVLERFPLVRAEDR